MIKALLKAAEAITGRRYRYRPPQGPLSSLFGIGASRRRQVPRPFMQRRVPSMFSLLVRDRFGNIKHEPIHHPNLRTNNGIDWQSGIMGDYTSFGTGTSAPTSNGTATTLTDTGQAWTTDQWKGHYCIFATTGGKVVFGVILSNTGTVLTVDGWWLAGTPGGAAQTAPQTTANYGILGGGVPHWWMALSTDGTAPAATDTTLTSEITTGGLARALPTSYSHTTGVNTYSVQKTFTASSTFTVNKEALFNAQNGGRMPFESAEPSPPTVVSGDTLQQTVTVTI